MYRISEKSKDFFFKRLLDPDVILFMCQLIEHLMLRTTILKMFYTKLQDCRREYKACTQIRPLNNNHLFPISLYQFRSAYHFRATTSKIYLQHTIPTNGTKQIFPLGTHHWNDGIIFHFFSFKSIISFLFRSTSLVVPTISALL